MSELIDLTKAIMYAILNNKRCTIAVHSNNQLVFATVQAHNIAANSGKSNFVTFKIVDVDDENRYPVGTIISGD